MMELRLDMIVTAVTIFLITYAGIAFGRIPGLMVDRTGIALLGAIGMIIAGVVPFETVPEAVHWPTIFLLYALMIISAQLRLGGFYTWSASRITVFMDRPRRFLLVSMLLSAILSALLANDIVCLAFTPVMTVSLLRGGLNPVPFLLGLAVSSNIGSAATIIGNPQNMLIGQVGNLSFDRFFFWCGPPALLSLLLSYLFICWMYRSAFHALPPANPVHSEKKTVWPELNRWQSTKGLIAVSILVALFFTAIPREIAAIAIAGLLLCSRKMHSREIMELLDWHLLTLFFALFVINEGIAMTNIPELLVGWLARHGMHMSNLFFLTGISAAMSNLVSNVPATMLLIRFLDPAKPVEWYILAVSSTFAGNLFVIGSIANLIVIEQAKRYGVHISFRNHAQVGIPVTVLSLLIVIGWVYL